MRYNSVKSNKAEPTIDVSRIFCEDLTQISKWKKIVKSKWKKTSKSEGEGGEHWILYFTSKLH